jgi:hypothetical protein
LREIKSASERNSEFVSAATRHYRVLQARSMRTREDIRIARRYASTCLTIEPRLIENRVFRWDDVDLSAGHGCLSACLDLFQRFHDYVRSIFGG